MRLLASFLGPSRLTTRTVRRRPPPEAPGILDEATTFSDVHNVILNPTTRLPYPEKQLRTYLEKTSTELMNDRRKMRYGGKKKASAEIVFDHIPIVDQAVVLFPGQGAQFVGMGKKISQVKEAKEIFETASEVLGYDILKMCLEGPKTKLEQTLYCQPAVVTAGVAAFEALKVENEAVSENLTDVAGFSVGEYGALVAARVLSFEDAIKIVKVRAEAMHECAQLVASGMATVRVKAASRLEEAMKEAKKAARQNGEIGICEVANYLFCGVRVVGASETCLKFLEEHQEEFKFQVVKRLEVASAFHTTQMDAAVEKVRDAVNKAEIQRATCNVYSNYTGHVFPAKKGEIRAALAKQVNSPVKWEQIQQLLYRKKQDEKFPQFYEVGPGRQLGMMLMQTSKKAFSHYTHFSC